MGPVPALNPRLERNVIPRERAHGIVNNFARERRVEHQVGVRRWRAVGAKWGRPSCSKEGLKGEIPADIVRNGIGNLHILESAGGDFIVICWIAPTTKAIIIRI